MQIAKQIGRLLRRRGGRPAQGDRQEEARRDGDDEGQVRRGLPRVGHRSRDVAEDLWTLIRGGGRLLVQQSHAACYALISYRTA